MNKSGLYSKTKYMLTTYNSNNTINEYDDSTLSYNDENRENIFQVENLVKRDPLYIVIPLTILYSIILVTGVIGNIITCIVIIKNKYMHTATNYYLLSLAISDLLLLIFGLPQEIYYNWSRYPYIFGETFCVLRGLMAETSTNATVLTISTFTIERYIAICHPFLVHNVSKSSRAVIFILIIWVIALLAAIPQALQFGLVKINGTEYDQCYLKEIIISHSFEISTLVFFVLPLMLIIILYTKIGKELKNSVILKQRPAYKPMITETGLRNLSENSITNHKMSQKKIIKMLIAIVASFFISWAPFHIQRLVAIYIVKTSESSGSELMVKIYDVVTYISAILYYTSSTFNPILYHTMSHKFRKAFKETIGSCRCGKDTKRITLINQLQPVRKNHNTEVGDKKRIWVECKL